MLVTEILRTNEEKIITHPNIQEKHLDKYGLHTNNIGTRILAKSLLFLLFLKTFTKKFTTFIYTFKGPKKCVETKGY